MEARFVPDWLLDGDLPDVARDAQARLLDGELRRLRSLDARLAILFGSGLARLLDQEGYRHLGHARVRDFVQSRYGLSIGAAYELRDLGAKLPQHALLRRAFEAGTLTTTKVRCLLKVVEPATEAGWVVFAQRQPAAMVSRMVNAALRKEAETPGAEPTPAPCKGTHETVSWHATAREAAAWKHGLEMLRTVAGASMPTWQLAEILVADSEFVPELPAQDEEKTARPNRRTEALTPERLADLAALLRLPPAPEPLDVADPCEVDDPWEMHERMAEILRLRCAVEFERATLLSLLHGRVLASALGFPTVHAYALATLGMSGKDTAAALDRQMETCLSPELAQAWHDGLPSSVVASLARVANPETVAAWVAFAQRCTRKRLQAEVQWHEVALLLFGRARYKALTDGLPDPEVTERKRRLDWQEFLGLRLAQLQQQKKRTAQPEPEVDDAEMAELEAVLAAEATPVSFSAPPEIAAMFTAAVEAHRLSVQATTGTLPTFGASVHDMLVEFAHAHAPWVDQTRAGRRRMREHRTFERDGYCCQAPECESRRNLHGHHVRWRSLGGTDDDCNLSTHCVGCHVLIHRGTIVLTGEAPDDLTYRLGRRPDGSFRETWRNGLRVSEPVREPVAT